MITYNRYSKFTNNGTINLVPFIKIPKMPTDYYVYYKQGQTRLDNLSYDYYNNPNYGWLILQANSEFGSLEFNIPDNTLLRIPYPLDVALSKYNEGVDEYNKLYGLIN